MTFLQRDGGLEGNLLLPLLAALAYQMYGVLVASASLVQFLPAVHGVGVYGVVEVVATP